MEAQKAQDDASLSASKERERKRPIPILNSSALTSSAVFANNMAAERTAAAMEAATRKERECTGLWKYLARHIEEANDQENNECYEDQDEEYEGELERKGNQCQFKEACVQLTTWDLDYDSDMQPFRIIWARNRNLSIDSYNELKAQDFSWETFAKVNKRLHSLSPRLPPL